MAAAMVMIAIIDVVSAFMAKYPSSRVLASVCRAHGSAIADRPVDLVFVAISAPRTCIELAYRHGVHVQHSDPDGPLYCFVC